MKTRIALIALTLTVLFADHSLALESRTVGPDATKKTLELPEFNSIFLNSNYTVYVKQSNKQEVVVEALSEIYSLSEFKVEEGVLHININKKKDNANNSIWSKIDNIKIRPLMKVTISMKDIKKLYVNSGGSIISENSLATQNIDLALNGSGNMDVDIKGNIVKTVVAGSGEMILKGYASNIDIAMSGSGTLHAFKLDLPKGVIEMMGSGLCEVNVSDELAITLYGSGEVKHKGDTRNTVKKIYGSGTVGRSY